LRYPSLGGRGDLVVPLRGHLSSESRPERLHGPSVTLAASRYNPGQPCYRDARVPASVQRRPNFRTGAHHAGFSSWALRGILTFPDHRSPGCEPESDMRGRER
jgi:hypothetical protein